MLTPEEVKEQLHQYENPRAHDDLLNRLHDLPTNLGALGIALVEGISSFGWDQERDRKRGEAKRGVAALAMSDRHKLFEALFPPIAEHVEASWQLQIKLPYQMGYLRKAFRAPNNPEYTANARSEWLEDLLKATSQYKYDLQFLTVWAAYLGWGAEHCIGLLLAGVLDSNHPARQRTYEGLVSILNGEHETARIGRYAVTALLSSSRPEAWEAVERLLLAAQRQEGLRQVVLESIDFAHPDAFVGMLRLIEREKLSRFAAVARAVAVWFGMNIDSAETKLIDGLVRETLENLQEHQFREEHLKSARGQSLYLALWASAFDDVTVATAHAERISSDGDFERRYAAVHLLSQLGTVEAMRVLRRCLADRDLRVAIKASDVIPSYSQWRLNVVDAAEVFVALKDLIARTPKDKVLEPAIWEWNRIRATQAALALKLIAHRGDLRFAALASHISDMDADGRRCLLQSMQESAKKRNELRQDERDIAFFLLSDASNAVRQQAFEILRYASVSASEAASIEPLLARKASDLRRGVIRLLLKQSAADCRASIERLSNSGDPLKMQAGEELRSELEPKSVPAASLQDGLGLFNPAERTRPGEPNANLKPQLLTYETNRLLRSLEDLIETHRETPITIKNPGLTEVRELLGNARWLDPRGDFPLSEVWKEWWQLLKAELGKSAGVELARALCTVIVLPYENERDSRTQVSQAMVSSIDLKFRFLLRDVLWHLLLAESTGDAIEFLLDVLENYLHRVSITYKPEAKRRPYSSWRTTAVGMLPRVMESCRIAVPAVWNEARWRRYWGLLRWIDEGIAGEDRHYPPLEAILEARKRGVATDADVFEQLLGARGQRGLGLHDLALVTKRKPAKLFEEYPELPAFVRICRDRILEVELKRGDLPTGASGAALSLRSVYGAELAATLLKQIGKDPLSRGYMTDNESKAVVLSHLLRVCLPTAEDTRESFTDVAKKLGLSKKRLVDFGVYAPQWAEYVAHAIGIAGFTDAAYWLHAHTKDSQWTIDEEIRELWFAAVSERTPLARQELLDGAVDIDWFRRVTAQMSSKDWELTLDSSKYASGGGGHKRAELFAAAISGEIKAAELSKRIIEKRNQDAVRAVGLVPLPAKDANRRREILQRYELLQRFLRESRKFGAMRQASEKLACSIGLANLARTAGYPDPLRLSWAMEAQAIADLRSGPVEATDGGVRAILSIDTLGEPQLAYEKNGKALKDLPASLRKSTVLSALRARKTKLAQQTSRMRQSLEEAMIRGDCFTFQELRELESHPLLKPMISSLLFACEDGEVRWHDALDAQSGLLRLAHPVDLLKSGSWPQRQRECIETARRQPFKQAFREVYLLTKRERDQKTFSGRYEGHQVNPTQATAIVGKRGWVNVPEEGLRKTFHHESVSAWVTFVEGWFTPAEVDGLTVEHVLFTNKNDGKVVPLDQVNDRAFSEAMRDLDLMVSVAHRGGVDPEATASTVDMRAALLRETLHLLKVHNVRMADRYAFVDGKLGAYNVHLGSGTVHRQPGGSLCIIPVHSQHRGRLFLPFADDDPKTAEIVSKVLLLAQDDKIKDPTILEQLR